MCAKVAEGEQRAVPEPKGAACPKEWCDPCMAVVLPCSGARGVLPFAGRDAIIRRVGPLGSQCVHTCNGLLL